MVNRKSEGTRTSRPDPGPWFEVLVAARKVGARNRSRADTPSFTARELALELSIKPSVASAYCSKFANWGYAHLEGHEGGGRGRGRAANVYTLTEYGLRRAQPTIGRRQGRPCPTCKGTGRIR